VVAFSYILILNLLYYEMLADNLLHQNNTRFVWDVLLSLSPPLSSQFVVLCPNVMMSEYRY
jgi:hypothetical protein